MCKKNDQCNKNQKQQKHLKNQKPVYSFPDVRQGHDNVKFVQSDESDECNDFKEIRDGTPDRTPRIIQSIASNMLSMSALVSAHPQACMPSVESVVPTSRPSRPFGSVLSALAERSANSGPSAVKPVCASVVVPAQPGPSVGDIAPSSCLFVSTADTPVTVPATSAGNGVSVSVLVEPDSAASLTSESIDRICRLESYEEMTFPAVLTQASVEVKVRCIVDNGCGLGYLLVPSGMTVPFATSPCKSRALLAQGDVVNISCSLVCCLSVNVGSGSVSKEVTLRVMQSSSDDELSVLFGRHLLEEFEIETRGANLVKLGRHILFKRDIVRRVNAVDTDDPGEIEVEGIVNLPSAKARPNAVSLPLDSQSEKEVDRLLSLLSDAGPQPMLHCPGSVCLRRIDPQSAVTLDTTDQTHFFELSLKSFGKQFSPSRLYAGAMIRTLNPSQQHKVGEAVEEYVKAGWWSSIPEGCPEPPIPVSNVFAVPKGDHDIRLVCDMRELNKSYPSTVSDQPQIPLSLSLLRLRMGCVAVGDCRSAFYRVRLSQPVPLFVGPFGMYHCYRMCFGLSFGPEGLQSSLGVLFQLLQLVWKVVGSLYVDDFWINGDPDTRALSLFLKLLSRCGFDVPESKFQLLTSERRSITLFGIKITFEEERSIVDCNRSGLLEDSRLMLSDPIRRSRLSKSDVFAVAGKIGYDPARCHCEGKVVADVLRSIAGSVQTDWNLPIDQDELPDKVLFESLLDWAVEIIQRECSGTCRHVIPRSKTPLCLRMSSDACNSGGAFCLEILSVNDQWSVLLEDAWTWKRQEGSYHSNRLEAMALFRSLRVLSSWIEFHGKAAPGEDKPVISVLTDSKSALAWATIGPSSAVTSGYESRAIMRLSQALALELSHVRSLVGEDRVAISHVVGSENAADRASRILERPASRAPASSIASLVHKRFARISKEKAAKRKSKSAEADVVRRFQALQTGDELAEQIASQSYDIKQAVWYIQLLRHVIRCWRNNSEGRARFPSPTFDDDDIAVLCSSALKTDEGLERSGNRSSLRPGPYGSMEHFRIDFNGQPVRTFYIPKSARAVVDLIVRSAHREARHRGVDHTCSLVGSSALPFFVEGLKTKAAKAIRDCFRCAVKNQPAPVIGSNGHTFPREINLPTFTRISCDVLFIESKKVLSVMCLDTGFLALLLISSAKIDDCLSGLRRLTNRFGVVIKYVRADRSFKSSRFSDALPGAVVSLTAPDTPYTNPVERLHAQARSILRSEKFLRRCVIGDSELEAQDALDQIAAVVNSRPLGRYSENGREGILTPAVIAFGTSMKTNELFELREYFYKCVFLELRRVRSSANNGGPQFHVGQRALYFNDNKSEPRFELCRVTDVRPPYFLIMLIGSEEPKRELVVGRGRLCPLELPFLDESKPMDVSRVGANISAMFEFDGEAQEFFGMVVSDKNGEIKIRWKDPRWTRSEFIDWRACRICS